MEMTNTTISALIILIAFPLLLFFDYGRNLDGSPRSLVRTAVTIGSILTVGFLYALLRCRYVWLPSFSAVPDTYSVCPRFGFLSDSLFPAALLLLWIAGIWLVTVKYLRALKSKSRLDQWIWLLLWCAFVFFIEWPVFFAYVLIEKMSGVTIQL